MSVKVMGRVWELELTPAKQIVLLALADHADHDGKNIRPGVPLIAWKTGYSERQVQRIMRELVEEGLLVEVETEKGKPHVYSLDLSKAVPKSPYEPRKPGRPKTDDKMSPHLDEKGVTSHEKDESKSGDIASANLTRIRHKEEPSLKEKDQLISSANDSAAASAENDLDCVSADSAEHTDVQETPSEHAPTPAEPPESSAKAPPGAASAPVHKPTADERNAMFEAVCAQVFGITSREEIRLMPRHEASEAGAITSWLLRQNDRFKPNGAKGATPIEVGWISAPAQPDHVRRFTGHYQSRYPSMNLPTKIATFVRHWRAWASELQREQQRAVQAQQNAAKPALPEVRATPEELAAIKAELGFQARRLTESERA